MKLTRLITFICTSLILSTSAIAEEIPAMLMVRSADQSASHGCNFVEQVAEIVYKSILSKKVKLWDSPEKEIQIMPAALKEIEKNAAISFKDIETIFIYELWSSEKKEVKTKTVGIAFSNRSDDPEKNISFGYVEYSQLNEIFLKNKIGTNANGNYSSTFKTYFLSHNYAFNLVQFAGKPVTSPTASEEILSSYTKGYPFNKSLLGYYPPDKYVAYTIDTFTDDSDTTTMNSRGVLKAFEKHFTENTEEFFNLGGDRVFSHLEKSKIKVNRVEISEMWRIIGGELNFDIQGITVYVNDSIMDEISLRQLQAMDIKYNDSTLEELLKNRDYNYIITRINSQTIKPQDSYLYQKALLSGKWDSVIEQVLIN